MAKNKRKKIVIWLIVIVCIAGFIFWVGRDSKTGNIGTLELSKDGANNTYALNDTSGKEAIVINAKAYNQKKSKDTTLLENIDEQGNTAVVTSGTGKAVWNFETSKEGIYYIKVKYYTVLGNTTDIQRNIYIDGEKQIEQAVAFKRSYSIIGEKKYDVQGNEIRSDEEENLCWQESFITDTNGYADGIYGFQIKEGKHEICFESVAEGMAIGQITLVSDVAYADKYSNTVKNQKTDKLQDARVKIQAEAYKAKSDASILLKNDKSSSATEPSSPSTIVYNTIGGSSWQKAGQWIEWEIETPEDGYYQLGMRWRQSDKMGGISSRSLCIDGQIPFEEVSRMAFNYNSSWQTSFLGEGEPWLFYLTKGKHIIRMTANLGDLADILKETDKLIEKLNSIYMKIIMVSGTSPDLNRDYDFKSQIPDVIEEYHNTAIEIESIIKEINERTKGQQSTTELQQVLDILNEMYKDPESTAKRLSDYQSSITTLASWLSDSCNQPLEIDYIMLTSKGQEMPKAGSGFLSSAVFSIRQLIASYTMDYTNIGNTNEQTDDDETLTVWVVAGTEQAQVVQQLINEKFIPETGISVKLQNVTTAAIMPAVLVGQGPDVVINLLEAEPVNYALRGVIKNLNDYEDINAVLKQFEPSTYEAFELEGGLYALPVSVDFPVLFYRKDILEEMDISLEDCETWDTTLQVVLPKLQIKNLKFGINPLLASYLTFYYQTGNELYSKDNMKIQFDTQMASESFKDYTSIYTDYGQNITFNFVNLFRSGEMPVAVMPYSSYYQLAEFAPEVMDKCGITLVPGTKDENGQVNHTTATTVTGASIFNSTKMPKEAWEFLKWWTGDEAQVRYAKDIETILGIAGRVSVASNTARKSISWPKEISDVLEQQLGQSKGVPQVPGSYYVSRYFDFGFRDVVYEDKDIVQTLISITEDINTEIKEKTEELHNNY